MRLDRLVSQAAGVSRSQARSLVRCGRVCVAGVALRSASCLVDEKAEVTLDGQVLALPGPLYLMLHKPCGLISATRDREQATVLSLLPAGLAARVHLVGRLDKDTSGLLLLTDDGAWSHRISSPACHCSKTYLVELAEPLVADAELRLAAGIQLRGETVATRPAILQRVADDRVRIMVSEGRYHLVRRLFAALGNRVVGLHRERVGALALDPSLPSGGWRPLDPSEVSAALGR